MIAVKSSRWMILIVCFQPNVASCHFADLAEAQVQMQDYPDFQNSDITVHTGSVMKLPDI